MVIGEGEDGSDQEDDEDYEGPGPTMSDICDAEHMDEEATQAAEIALFAMIVQPPLQVLDLKIPDPVFFFGKSSGSDSDGPGSTEFILLTILRNFAGT